MYCGFGVGWVGVLQFLLYKFLNKGDLAQLFYGYFLEILFSMRETLPPKLYDGF